MSEKDQIKKGGLRDKLSGYAPEPPEAVWEGISKDLKGGGGRRRLFILLSAAAGLALAVSVGIRLFTLNPGTAIQETFSENNKQEAVEETFSIKDPVQRDDVESQALADVKNQRSALQTPALEISKRKSPGLEEKVRMALGEQLDEEKEENLRIANNLNEPVEINATVEENQANEVIEVIEINEDSLLKLLVPEITDIEEEAKEPKSRKWQLGAGLAPQYSYRDAASPNVNENLKVNNSETAKITYSGGVHVGYKASKRLAIESGVYYNKMGVNIGDYNNFRSERNVEYLEAGNSSNNIVSISNSMGTAVSKDKSQFINSYSKTDALSDFQALSPEVLVLDNSAVSGFSQTFEFLEIPVSLKYLLIDRSFKVQLIGGVSTNLLMNNRLFASTASGSEEIGEFIDLSTFNYSGNAGLGFVYDFARNFSFSLEPRFKYYLNSINNSQLPPTRPYSFGVMTGVSYLF